MRRLFFIVIGVLIAFHAAAEDGDKRVYGDVFLGLGTRDVSGHSVVWWYYNNEAGVENPADLYQTTYRKQCIATLYPRIGLYDMLDDAALEYQVLLQKLIGFDGLFGEWQDGDFNNKVLLKLAETVSEHGLETGVNWITQCLFEQKPWKKKLETREDAFEYAKQDIRFMLKELYAKPYGLRENGRPVILLFSANDYQPKTLEEFFIGPDDVDMLRAEAQTVGENPMFLASRVMMNQIGHLDGWFPIVEVHHPDFIKRHSRDEQTPWVKTSTPEQQVEALKTFYEQARHHAPRVPYYMGGVWRGFRDHKDQAWGLKDPAFVPANDGATLELTFDALDAADVDRLFFWTWNDPAESTGILPSLEVGYQDVDIAARRIAQWKEKPAPSSTILRLPERLLFLRRDAALLKTLRVPEAGQAQAALDQAANALSGFDETGAVTALDTAESVLDAGWQNKVSAEPIDLEWRYDMADIDEPPLGLLHVDWPALINKDGKTGCVFLGQEDTQFPQLPFALSDDLREKMRSGEFVGRLAFEFLDEGDEWLIVQVDSREKHMKEIAKFRKQNTGQWREVEIDFTNARFIGGLDGADFRIQQLWNSGGGGLRSVRLEGTLYTRSAPVPSEPNSHRPPHVKWAARLGGLQADYAHDVLALSDGGALVAGEFRKTMCIDGHVLTSRGVSDAFVARFDPSGHVVWAASGGGPHNDIATNVWLNDAQKTVTLAGWSLGNVAFGDKTFFTRQERPFVVTYDFETGVVLSAGETVEPTLGASRQRDRLPDGATVRTSRFQTSKPLGPARVDRTMVQLVSRGAHDVSLAKYAEDSTIEWAVSPGGPGEDWGEAVSAFGNQVACVGSFEQDIAFDKDTVLTSKGGFDAFVVLYETRE